MSVIEDRQWHKVLGHASEEKLCQIECFSRSKNSIEKTFCDSCVKDKQTCLPFPSSSIKTFDCFDLTHCNIWGSYHVPSTSGARYFSSMLMILSVQSGFIWLSTNMKLVMFDKFLQHGKNLIWKRN